MAKNKAAVDMTKGAIRFMGIAKHQFMRAIGYAVVNLRLLLAFEERTRTQSPPPTTRRRRTRRRQNYSDALNRIPAFLATGNLRTRR